MLAPQQKLYLGLVMGTRPEWAQYFSPPKPDGRLTDQVKIAADLSKKQAELAMSAPYLPVAGIVLEAAVIDGVGETVLHVKTGTDVSPELLAFVCNRKPLYVPVRKPDKLPFETQAFSYELEYGSDTQDPWLYGIDLAANLRVAGVAAAAKISTPLPAIWHSSGERSHIVDPYAAAITTEKLREQVSVHALCAFLGQPCPDDIATSAIAQARVVRDLAVALGL